jgi:single-strand DNA-binding protein
VSYNRLIVIGNLTKDPQLSFTPNDTAVVDFTVATNRRVMGKKNTCYFYCRCFGKRAEAVNQYLSKGSQVHVDGSLQNNTWTGQDGKQRSRMQLLADTITFLRSRNSGDSGESQSDLYQNTTQEENAIQGEYDDFEDIAF